jgi:membrane protein insertase Oxa1/YidC/SpoIIIJ
VFARAGRVPSRPAGSTGSHRANSQPVFLLKPGHRPGSTHWAGPGFKTMPRMFLRCFRLKIGSKWLFGWQNHEPCFFSHTNSWILEVLNNASSICFLTIRVRLIELRKKKIKVYVRAWYWLGQTLGLTYQA